MPAHSERRRARNAVLWGLFFLAGSQLAMCVAVECWRPGWSDPEYGYRVERLRRRVAHEPGRPLVVVLGSSRVSYGFDTNSLPAAGAASPGEPLLFNFGMPYAGSPVMELIVLKRLLALGIHPRGVVLEVLPPQLYFGESVLNDPGVFPDYRLRFADLGVLRRHSPERAAAYTRRWLVRNLVPCYTDRYCLLGRYAPWLLDPRREGNLDLDVDLFRRAIGRGGYMPLGISSVTPELYRRFFTVEGRNHREMWEQFPGVSPKVDRAFRELLELCRREGIGVVGVLLMPEAKEFQALCPPGKRALVHDYLAGLCREYHTELIDASDWAPPGSFLDGHHMLPPAAAPFTRRFYREVIVPRGGLAAARSVGGP